MPTMVEPTITGVIVMPVDWIAPVCGASSVKPEKFAAPIEHPVVPSAT